MPGQVSITPFRLFEGPFGHIAADIVGLKLTPLYKQLTTNASYIQQVKGKIVAQDPIVDDQGILVIYQDSQGAPFQQLRLDLQDKNLQTLQKQILEAAFRSPEAFATSPKGSQVAQLQAAALAQQAKIAELEATQRAQQLAKQRASTTPPAPQPLPTANPVTANPAPQPTLTAQPTAPIPAVAQAQADPALLQEIQRLSAQIASLQRTIQAMQQQGAAQLAAPRLAQVAQPGTILNPDDSDNSDDESVAEPAQVVTVPGRGDRAARAEDPRNAEMARLRAQLERAQRGLRQANARFDAQHNAAIIANRAADENQRTGNLEIERLRHLLANSEAKFDRANSNTTLLTGLNGELQSKLDEANGTIRVLRAELGPLHDEIARLREKNQRLRDELQSSGEGSKVLIAEIGELRNALAKNEQLLKSQTQKSEILEAQIDDITSIAAVDRHELLKNQKELEHANLTNKDLINEIETLRRALQDRSSNIEALEAQAAETHDIALINRADAEAQHQRELEELRARIAAQDATIQTQTVERLRAREDNLARKGANERQRAELSQLHEALKESGRRIEELQAQEREQEQSLNLASAEVERLRELVFQIGSLKEEAARLRDQKSRQAQEALELRQQLAQTANDNDDLREKLKTAERKVQSLTASIIEKDARIAELKEEVEDNQTAIQMAEMERDRLRQSIADLQKQIKALEQDLHEAAGSALPSYEILEESLLLRDRLEALEAELREKTALAAQTEARLQELSGLFTEIEKASYRSAAEYERRIEELTSALRRSRDELRATHDDLAKEREAFRGLERALRESEGKRRELETRAARLQREIEALTAPEELRERLLRALEALIEEEDPEFDRTNKPTSLNPDSADDNDDEAEFFVAHEEHNLFKFQNLQRALQRNARITPQIASEILEARIAQLQKELERVPDVAVALDAAAGERAQMQRAHQEELDDQRDSVKRLTRELKAARTANEELSLVNSAEKVANESLRKAEEELNSERISELRKALSSAQRKISELERALANKETEKDITARELEANRAELKTLENELDATRIANTKLVQAGQTSAEESSYRIAQLEKDLEKEHAGIEELETNLAHQKTDLSDAARDIESQRALVEGLTRELDLARKANYELSLVNSAERLTHHSLITAAEELTSERIAKLEKVIEAANAKISELERSLANKESNLAAAANELADQKAKAASLQERLEEAQAANAKIAEESQASATQSSDRMAQLEKSLEEAHSRIKELESNLAHQEKALLAAGHNLKAQETTAAALDRELQDARAANQELRQQVALEQASSKNIMQALGASSEKITSLERDLENTQTKVAPLEEELEAKRADREESEKEFVELQDINESLIAKYTELEQRYNETDRDLQQAIESAKNWQQHYDEAALKLTEKETALAELRDRNRALEAELATLTERLAATEKRNRKLEDSLLETNRKLALSEEKVKEIEKQLASERTRASGNGSQASQLQTDLAAAREENANLRERQDRLETELAASVAAESTLFRGKLTEALENKDGAEAALAKSKESLRFANERNDQLLEDLASLKAQVNELDGVHLALSALRDRTEELKGSLAQAKDRESLERAGAEGAHAQARAARAASTERQLEIEQLKERLAQSERELESVRLAALESEGRLGEVHLENSAEIERLKNDIAHLKALLAASEKEKDTLNQELLELRIAVRTTEDDMRKLKEKLLSEVKDQRIFGLLIRMKSTTIRELKEELRILNERLSNMGSVTAAQLETIGSLGKRINELEFQNSELQALQARPVEPSSPQIREFGGTREFDEEAGRVRDEVRRPEEEASLSTGDASNPAEDRLQVDPTVQRAIDMLHTAAGTNANELTVPSTNTPFMLNKALLNIELKDMFFKKIITTGGKIQMLVRFTEQAPLGFNLDTDYLIDSKLTPNDNTQFKEAFRGKKIKPHHEEIYRQLQQILSQIPSKEGARATAHNTWIQHQFKELIKKIKSFKITNQSDLLEKQEEIHQMIEQLVVFIILLKRVIPKLKATNTSLLKFKPDPARPDVPNEKTVSTINLFKKHLNSAKLLLKSLQESQNQFRITEQ